MQNFIEKCLLCLLHLGVTADEVGTACRFFGAAVACAAFLDRAEQHIGPRLDAEQRSIGQIL